MNTSFGEGWFSPQLDVKETDKELTLHAELPGCKKEDLHLEVRDDSLEISGKKEVVDDEQGQNFVRSERRFGEFKRIVPIPEGVKPDDVKATYVDGVLEVRVPKPPESLKKAKGSSINIQ